MTKLFASDFDGTIYFQRRTPPVSEGARAAVKAFQEAGGRFGYCTGRPIDGILPFVKRDVIDADFYITSTGAHILDHDGNAIFSKGIDEDAAWELIGLLRDGREDDQLSVHLDGKFCLFCGEGSKEPPQRDPSFSAEILHRREDFAGRTIHNISIRMPDMDAAIALAARVNEALAGAVHAFVNVCDIDIVAEGCSKGAGIERIRDYYHDARIYGMGDSLNDMALVAAADCGFTFHDAPEELRKAAARTFGTVEEAILFAKYDEKGPTL